MPKRFIIFCCTLP